MHYSLAEMALTMIHDDNLNSRTVTAADHRIHWLKIFLFRPIPHWSSTSSSSSSTRIAISIIDIAMRVEDVDDDDFQVNVLIDKKVVGFNIPLIDTVENLAFQLVGCDLNVTLDGDHFG